MGGCIRFDHNIATNTNIIINSAKDSSQEIKKVSRSTPTPNLQATNPNLININNENNFKDDEDDSKFPDFEEWDGNNNY